jgi:lysophospholipase L1-like esterase
MFSINRNLFTYLSAFFILTSTLSATTIKPTDQRIKIQGSLYHKALSNGSVEFFRFPNNVLKYMKDRRAKAKKPSNAETTSGVKLLFKTDAKDISLKFKINKGTVDRGSDFAVYKNGKLWKELRFRKKKTESYPFEFTMKLTNDSSEAVVYTVALPSYSNPIFCGMTLNDGAELKEFSVEPKKVYVAYGDSVSHGTGQRSASYLTWPYKLSEKLGFELYNIAIGGSSIDPERLSMFKDFKKIDLLTVYIGINDAGKKSPEEFKKAYANLLSTIRASHPETKIVCISMHTMPEGKKGRGGFLLSDYAQPVKDVVAAMKAEGDNNILLVDGTQLAGLEDAMSPGNVHLSIKGADKWANKLYGKIKEFVK